MDRAGTAKEVQYLVASIEMLKCFPEVPKALARLQTRYKLAVLSNGDPDMLEAAKKYHGIPFDKVVAAIAGVGYGDFPGSSATAARIFRRCPSKTPMSLRS
jgi:2-haloacid dehalogenase